MSPDKDPSSNNFVRRAIMYRRRPSKLLSARRALQITLRVVNLYAADKALNKLSPSLLRILVQSRPTFLAMYIDNVNLCFTHVLLPNDEIIAPNFGGHTPTHALHDMQEEAITARGRSPCRSTSDSESNAQASMHNPQPVH